MSFTLPPATPVDSTKRGLLTICPPAFRGLLGLGAEYEIVGFDVDIDGNLQVAIAGGDMPPMGLSPAPVSLVAQLTDTGIELCWQHSPEKRWRLP
jgi:hypothetical protein